MWSRNGTEGSWRLQVVAVVEGGRRSGPVGEPRRTNTWSNQIEFGNTWKLEGSEVALELINSLFSWRGLAHLRQAVKVKFVRVALSVHLGHDVFVVVIAQSSAQFVVVHVRFTLAFPPPSGHLVRVYQFKLSIGPLPGDACHIGAVRQQLQEKLP